MVPHLSLDVSRDESMMLLRVLGEAKRKAQREQDEDEAKKIGNMMDKIGDQVLQE